MVFNNNIESMFNLILQQTQHIDFGNQQIQQIPLQIVDSNGNQFMVAAPEMIQGQPIQAIDGEFSWN